MNDSQKGGCISFVIWLIITIVISALSKSVWIGLISGTAAILLIAYFITKDD